MNYFKPNCDSIAWFVDILGTMDLLEEIARRYGEEILVNNVSNYKISELRRSGQIAQGEELRRIRQNLRSLGQTVDVPNGLYFMEGHWYSVMNGKKADSYSQKYQIRGTAHFCQTFALMMILRLDKKLVREEWAYNIQQAMEFWARTLRLKENRDILDWLLKEIRTSDYAMNNKTFKYNDPNSGKIKEVNFKNIKWKDLINFIDMVHDHAHSFIGCKESF